MKRTTEAGAKRSMHSSAPSCTLMMHASTRRIFRAVWNEGRRLFERATPTLPGFLVRSVFERGLIEPDVAHSGTLAGLFSVLF
jgi:hypothetical protein